MYMIGIDIGTTNTKAGVFDVHGKEIAVASKPTHSYTHADGYAYYDPEEMWAAVAELVRDATATIDASQVACIGITSMAESGLLIDRRTGEVKSPFMPWFDTCSQPQSDWIAERSDKLDRFRKSGLHNSFKLGLAKILWIKERFPEALRDTVWISAAGYIAYRLSGHMAFDYTLAARTYAFRIDTKQWDADWLRSLDLDATLFPEARPSGEIIGQVHQEAARQTGLFAGVPVAIGGHDHVCAALAVGAIKPGIVYDSMGTAETLVGTFEERKLTEEDFAAGISFGCHIAGGRMFWMGGNSASGGSIEWLRGQLGGTSPLEYAEILSLLDSAKSLLPTGILYYPYLSGSGAPYPDAKAKAAFIGLAKEHGKADLLYAVLEGTAYQLETIRRKAERIAGHAIDTLSVVGGGRRIRQWLQVKADITNCRLELPDINEATMLGAAMAAGIGCGVYGTAEEAAAAIKLERAQTVEPNASMHRKYQHFFEAGYEQLQEPLRAFYRA